MGWVLLVCLIAPAVVCDLFFNRGRKNGGTVRGANRKTYLEIHREIRAAQSTPAPPSRGMPGWLQKAFLLPPPFAGWFGTLLEWAMRRDPTIFTSLAGTVGMFGKGQGGWGVSPLTHGLNLIVGGISWKPAVIDGRIEPREILDLTVTYDHDVIDGAPAARFTQRLVELIEQGVGLDD